MAGADDATIQALGRWLNPASIRIYKRMSVQEYSMWVDRMMRFETVKATRTNNVIIDADQMAREWQHCLNDEPTPKRPRHNTEDAFDRRAADAQDDTQPYDLRPGQKIEVYWTAEATWYTAEYRSSTIERGENGKRRLAHLIYDPVGEWTTRKDNDFWHCLHDETWRVKNPPTRPASPG